MCAKRRIQQQNCLRWIWQRSLRWIHVKNALPMLISKIHWLISINNRFQMFCDIYSQRILWHGHKTLVRLRSHRFQSRTIAVHIHLAVCIHSNTHDTFVFLALTRIFSVSTFHKTINHRFHTFIPSFEILDWSWNRRENNFTGSGVAVAAVIIIVIVKFNLITNSERKVLWRSRAEWFDKFQCKPEQLQ